MSNHTQYWDDRRNKIFSRTGGWRVGHGVSMHGHDLLEELVGEASFFQLLLLATTGKLPEPRVARWWEAAFMCMSWPDPRIWCNQISTLAAETKCSIVAATTAGTLANDSYMYGAGSALASMNFITQALRDFENGMSVKEIVRNEVRKSRGKLHITGYVRPIAKGDERVIALEKFARKLQFSIGPHEKLAFEIEDYLIDNFSEGMNAGGYMTAFLSDQGFTPQQVYNFSAMIVFAGVEACYIDNVTRPYGSFLPLRCDDIEYTGKPIREIPAG
ncbi:MAG: hypothetical protein ACR2PS_03145 [Pseudomonadales bacterium]